MKKTVIAACLLFHILVIGAECSGRDRSYIKKIDTQYENEFSCDIIQPNPMAQAGAVFANFNLPESCSVSVVVLNTALNGVYKFNEVELAPGIYQVSWNNVSMDDGAKVETGIYCLDIVAGSADKKKHNLYRCRHRFIAFN